MPHSEAKKRQTIGLLTKSLVEVRRSPAWEEMVNLRKRMTSTLRYWSAEC